jgi:hypothetical protein
MSALKGDYIGPWIKLSVNPEDVKVPRKIKFNAEPSDGSHGLWGFFNEKQQLLSTPVEESQHGKLLSLSRDLKSHNRQGEPGPTKSCAASRSTTCTGYGGLASASRTAFSQKTTHERRSRLAMASTRPIRG